MSTPSLYHLVYQSVATAVMSEKELEALLTQARTWNTGHTLTGVLLYSNGEIMQVLEGTEEEVRYIFNRIAQDPRHRNVTKLADGEIQQRNFSQWSMGFKAVEPADFAHLAGYLNVNKQDYLSAQPGYSKSTDATLHSLLASFVTDDVIRF
ncbi:BLUF domain-containing protein [Hymenobacter cavernae]|uniref:BluF domain-containing protein n=1 Tax=Hymenobacter cavernae TaxID=2044852 RepID=A0ABQ1UCZ9_9BACT|nr:BLUF domain-containing protein [Hymenobacter cavernae]GGF13678.1 BluF domain-containing protein [Hymenobacter cavernae]